MYDSVTLEWLTYVRIDIVLLFSLPNYATSLGFSPEQGALVGAMLNLGQGKQPGLVNFVPKAVLRFCRNWTTICWVLQWCGWSYKYGRNMYPGSRGPLPYSLDICQILRSVDFLCSYRGHGFRNVSSSLEFTYDFAKQIGSGQRLAPSRLRWLAFRCYHRLCLLFGLHWYFHVPFQNQWALSFEPRVAIYIFTLKYSQDWCI